MTSSSKWICRGTSLFPLWLLPCQIVSLIYWSSWSWNVKLRPLLVTKCIEMWCAFSLLKGVECVGLCLVGNSVIVHKWLASQFHFTAIKVSQILLQLYHWVWLQIWWKKWEKLHPRLRPSEAASVVCLYTVIEFYMSSVLVCPMWSPLWQKHSIKEHNWLI